LKTASLLPGVLFHPVKINEVNSMKALCWHGTNDIRCDNVPDPKIEDGRDVIIKVTSCAICGSDLHLMDGLMPTMKSGDILGHEFMGEVVETGSAHTKFLKGDRIIVPFNINCGECRQCKLGNYSVCQRSNRNAAMAAAQFGYTTAGLFGYSHLTGGYAGGQAEYVRVPMADVAPMKVPEGMEDEEVLFLTDIFPTGYQAAEQAGIKGGEIVAVWGTGPVGLFAIQSAKFWAPSASSRSKPYRSGSPWRERPAPPTSSIL
jgi:threonine dehydrogenase-like Zn-dependent dehydrogenase